MKSWFEAAAVVVCGALFGSFLGKALACVAPAGKLRDLLATDIAAGLRPTSLDLHIVELTVGCMFRLNVLSVIGILAAAFLYKRVLR